MPWSCRTILRTSLIVLPRTRSQVFCDNSVPLCGWPNLWGLCKCIITLEMFSAAAAIQVCMELLVASSQALFATQHIYNTTQYIYNTTQYYWVVLCRSTCTTQPSTCTVLLGEIQSR
eukprot:scpid110181/ scgid23673/ 